MNKLNIPIYYAVYITSNSSRYFQKRLKYTDTYESIEYRNKLVKREIDYMHEIELAREMNSQLASLSEDQRLNKKKQLHINNTINRFDYINKSIQIIQEVIKKQK
jgi:hypothetical protein